MGEYISRDETTEWLSKYFKNYYDVSKLSVSSEEYPILRCDLHVSNQKYFLTKKSVLWEANCHEYVYVFSVSHLTEDLYRKLETYVITEGSKLIEPKKTHMYTYLTLFVVCDTIDKDAEKALKKCKIRKDYKMALYGWMELHTALLVCESERFATNRGGHEYKKLLRNISNSNMSKKGR